MATTTRILVRHPGQTAPRRGDVVLVDERPLTVARVEVVARARHHGPALPTGATAYRVELAAAGARPMGRPRGRIHRTGLTYPCPADGCPRTFDTAQGRHAHHTIHVPAACDLCPWVGNLAGVGTHRRRAHGIRKATA